MTSAIMGGISSLLDGLARSVWTGTLSLLRGVLALVGKLGRIDPTPGAGAISSGLWTTMLQVALLVALILFFAQLAMAALNPRRNMLTAVVGPFQYGVATAVTVGIVVALLGAADGLTAVILQQGAGVTDAAAAMDRMGLTDDTNAVKAVVLAVLGIVAVLPLALGYGVMLLFRSATILVLIATLPIVSAGLVNLATRHWFWRATRWLLALIFLQPTFALVFSLGTGVVSAAGAGSEATPGQAAPAGGTGVVTLLLGLAILFVALFAPMGLFRLFAFVEPGTMPHQTMMSAFSSAVDGFKQAGSGIAQADIGSVLAGATGGRFGGSGGDGSAGSSGGDDKKQLAATAAMAATGGASTAAAGAGGASAAGASGSSSAAGAGGTSSAGGAGAMAHAGAGGGAGSTAGSGTAEPEDAVGGELTGAGAAAPVSARGGAGAAAGSSSSGGGGSSGSAGGEGGGSMASLYQQSKKAVGGNMPAGVSAAGSALGSVGGGAFSAAQGIAGYGPMPPAPLGGPAGRYNDPAPADFGGAVPIARRSSNPYRDPSYDQPYAGSGGGTARAGGPSDSGPPDPGPPDPGPPDGDGGYGGYEDDYDDDDDGSGRFAGVM